jgi:hypothetical protein
MAHRQDELASVLAEVRRRWTRRARLSAWAVGTLAAAMLLGVGGLTVWLLASEGLPLAFVVVIVLAAVAVTLVAAGRPVAQPPSDLQLARFIEEQAGGLDDVVVTAAQHGASASAPGAALEHQAVRAVEDVGYDRIISSDTLRRAAIGALAGTLVFLAGSAAFAPTMTRGLGVAAAYLLPSRLLIEVAPGTTKLRAGSPLTITARLRGLEAGLVPELHIGEDGAARAVRMTAAGDGTFSVTFDKVQESFPYAVTAGPSRSDDYAIEVIRPARVARIDLRYRYPEGLGLPPRVEEDGGDIFGPAGTTVDLTIVTDKPIATGALTLADGTQVALAGGQTSLSASLPIKADSAYRVALTDVDGLENPGDTEYFIRMLNDRPPDVRVLRPGGDKQVTPLEEVEIEVRAEDDFGVASLELVFQVPGQKDTVIPFDTRREVSAGGRHLIQLESLGVRPGDFVTYHARARDVGRGRRGTDTLSDIFFLEVKPFEETFVAAQSQSMGMQGSPQLQELAAAQKEIISATWKLDARAKRAGAKQSAADIKAVAEAQAELRTRAAEQAGDVAQALADPRRRRVRPGQTTAAGADDPMARAVEAMGRATGALESLKTADALPHEMEALEQLLKADSDVKQRQIARQQGGGGGSNRPTPDLSTLFDQQLRKQQQTNYETPTNTESRPETTPEEDALAKIRELARRQEALQRAQRDLARGRDRMSDEEIKRQLERLTREQQQLTEQANDLSKQLQEASRSSNGSQSPQEQQSPSSPSQGQSSESQGSQSRQGQTREGQQQGGQQASGSRRLRDIAEQMRGAASELRKDDPEQASARSAQAVEQLRELSRQMERARPDERRRAMGDLQFETRQLAEAERRLATEAENTGSGGAGDEARRRMAAEQERLAERADRVRQAARELAETPGAAGEQGVADASQAAAQAAREMERERIAERMRAAAEAMRQPGATGTRGEESRDLARALDRIAGELGEAAGTADRETEKLSEQLARAGELRDRLNELQRSIDALEQEASQGQQGGRPGSDAEGQRSAQGQAQGQSAEQSASESSESPSGDASGGGSGGANRLSRLQREAADRMREAQRLAGELQQQSSDMKDAGTTPENWYPSLSAPGTEAFKQDYSKWESLKKHLLAALEKTETRVSGQLREREARERLNAGGHQGVSSDYQEMVDRYYQSLATPRRAPR